MPTDHAILSPSASKRWMTCAPSARAEQGCPETSTSYSVEGTLAHKTAEIFLNCLISADYDYVPDFEDFKNGLPEPMKDELSEIGLTLSELEGSPDFGEMLETVFTYYVTPVYEDYINAKQQDKETVLLVEARLKLDSFIPEGFGSSDAVLITDTELHVYDLKYGKGVKVEAENNPQMMCYAIGAAMGPAEIYCINRVKMTIIQPRLQHISTAELSWEELYLWATKTLRPAAEKAFTGEGAYVAGDHCKFCKFAPRCRACMLRAKVSIEAYGEPEGLTDTELATALGMVESIKTWASKLEEYALNYAMNGHKVPGWKVVEGRSISKVSDMNAAITALHDKGFDDETILKPRELKTITDLKKILRKSYDDILAPYVVKPQGKPTIVPDSDRRQEYTGSTAADFQ